MKCFIGAQRLIVFLSIQDYEDDFEDDDEDNDEDNSESEDESPKQVYPYIIAWWSLWYMLHINGNYSQPCKLHVRIKFKKN